MIHPQSIVKQQVVDTSFYWQIVHSLAVMYIASSEHDKTGYVVLFVNQGVHLENSLVVMELSPRTKLQAQIGGTAVKGIHHVVYAQAVIFDFIQNFCLVYKHRCIVLIDTPIFLLIHIGKSESWHNLQTSMIQLGVERSQLIIYATKTCTSSKLSITHDKELVATSESSCMKIPSISVNTFPEFVVRNERHQLREYSISGIHVLCYLIDKTVQRYKIKSGKMKSLYLVEN